MSKISIYQLKKEIGLDWFHEKMRSHYNCKPTNLLHVAGASVSLMIVATVASGGSRSFVLLLEPQGVHLVAVVVLGIVVLQCRS